MPKLPTSGYLGCQRERLAGGRKEGRKEENRHSYTTNGDGLVRRGDEVAGCIEMLLLRKRNKWSSVIHLAQFDFFIIADGFGSSLRV
jgi:hypothetical protein